MLQVYNSRNGELVRYVFEKQGYIASQVLVFMAVGLGPKNPLKSCVGYFGTRSATDGRRAVPALLEGCCTAGDQVWT